MGKKKKKKARKHFVKKLKKFLQIVPLITGIVSVIYTVLKG